MSRMLFEFASPLNDEEVQRHYFQKPLSLIESYLRGIVGAQTELIVEINRKGGAVVTSLENVGFGCHLAQIFINRKRLLVPTISYIHLNDMTGVGHGSQLLKLWEASFPVNEFSVLGASSLDNPRYFISHGYVIRLDQKYLLKKRN